MIIEIENAMNERKQLHEEHKEVNIFLDGLISRYEAQNNKKNSDALETVILLLISTKKHLSKIYKENKELAKLIDLNTALEIKLKNAKNGR